MASESKLVFGGIAKARNHLAKEGLGKNQFNEHQKFKFRGVDDLLGIVQPALDHGEIVMLPDVLEVERKEYTTAAGKLQFYTVVRVDYHFVHVGDGSTATFCYAGEAADTGDKSLSKALTMAFKSFCFHVFQIPLNGNDDADKHTADETAPPSIPEDVVTMLSDAAAEGMLALKGAWKQISPETRELIGKFYKDWWNGLKAKAVATE